MKVLVAVASTDDATMFVGTILGLHLSTDALDVEIRAAAEIVDLEAFDAVVVGCDLQRGRWRREGRKFVKRHAEALMDRPVWLYSAGAVTGRDAEEHDDIDLAAVMRVIGIHEHRVFSKAVEAPHVVEGSGDPDAWNEIADWALHIANELVVHQTWMAGRRIVDLTQLERLRAAALPH